ncbi:MAG: hypothetical protein JJT96_18805 [Opitutales bacterium]|nr:hypothetical protein [Opitutales bacterium]
MDSLDFALFYPPSAMDLSTVKARRACREAVPLLSLSGVGNYAREVERLADVLEVRWTVRARLTSLVMLGELAKPMGCAVFLPILAEPFMREQGFAMVRQSNFSGLTRNYSAVYDPRVARMQQNIGEFARALRHQFGSHSSSR